MAWIATEVWPWLQAAGGIGHVMALIQAAAELCERTWTA